MPPGGGFARTPELPPPPAFGLLLCTLQIPFLDTPSEKCRGGFQEAYVCTVFSVRVVGVTETHSVTAALGTSPALREPGSGCVVSRPPIPKHIIKTLAVGCL